jgi:deglycase
MRDSWPYCSLWQATQLAAYQYCSEETNMSHDLTSVKIAALIGAAFEEDHVLDGQEFLHEAGATVMTILAAEDLPESGKRGGILARISLEAADAAGFDALLLLVGQKSADSISGDERVIDFVRTFLAGAKPVGAIAYGAKVLLAADGVAGRRITAPRPLKELMQEAGAVWVDKSLAIDRNLVTGADTRPDESFWEAFAQTCYEYRAGSGTSLHTD